MKNITLIGMPAAGKSTVGIILAKTLGFGFIDTDLIIQNQTGRLLQQIIDSEGLDAFCAAEEHAILSVTAAENTVIATGGSAVYSEKAMLYLRENSVVYYLSLPNDELLARLRDIKTRGIAMRKGETVEDVFRQRRVLYEKFADYTISCSEKNTEQIVCEIAKLHEKP